MEEVRCTLPGNAVDDVAPVKCCEVEGSREGGVGRGEGLINLNSYLIGGFYNSFKFYIESAATARR